MIYTHYHCFGDEYKNRYYISKDCLKEQLSFMTKSSKEFCVTIDDGHKSIYEIAFPVLTEFEIPIIVFIVSSDIGKRNVNVSQIQEMSKYGISFQSHSNSHINHYLLNNTQILNEGLRSKEIIENITGKMVSQYAFPHGAYSIRFCKLLKTIGFNEFFTSDYGARETKDDGIIINDRIEIFKNEEIDFFLKKSTILRRRLRIKISKFRMNYLPWTYKAKTINWNDRG